MSSGQLRRLLHVRRPLNGRLTPPPILARFRLLCAVNHVRHCHDDGPTSHVVPDVTAHQGHPGNDTVKPPASGSATHATRAGAVSVRASPESLPGADVKVCQTIVIAEPSSTVGGKVLGVAAGPSASVTGIASSTGILHGPATLNVSSSTSCIATPAACSAIATTAAAASGTNGAGFPSRGARFASWYNSLPLQQVQGPPRTAGSSTATPDKACDFAAPLSSRGASEVVIRDISGAGVGGRTPVLPQASAGHNCDTAPSIGPLPTSGTVRTQLTSPSAVGLAPPSLVTSPYTAPIASGSHNADQLLMPPLSRPYSHANRIFMPEEEFREGKTKALRGDDAPPANVEDILFDMFKETDDTISVAKFFSALFATGLKKNDHRLKEMVTNLRAVHKERGATGSLEGLSLDKATFKNVLKENIVLITRALRHQFVIPDFQDFSRYVEDFYWKCKQNKGGTVASYIPQLAKYSPDFWGVAICTVDGQRFSLGDADVPFTIQSSGKPLNYAIALSELGSDTVHQYVGQEPSGRMFNELVLDYNQKPHNPMVNAGAIMIASLLLNLIEPEMRASEKFDWMSQYYRAISGGEYLSFNNAIFLSEREAADRNYAIGYYMKENKCFPEKVNLKDTMDFYFQLCSLEVNCHSVSVMAATLANGGICPITGHQVINPNSCRDVLSLMHSCGMYDYSGQYAFKVGLPAKSGVSGCTMVVVPNVMGLGLWSPPLDNYGNSVRGVQFCEELIRVFSFHHYDNLRHMTQKKDPRRQKYDTKGQKVVNLLFSAASGDVTAMRRHYLSGMNMGLSDYDGRTALHLAAAEGHLEAVEFLLRICGVSPDDKDRWGHTPADDARTFGHMHIVEFLSNWASSGVETSIKDDGVLKNKDVEEKEVAKPDLKGNH